MTVIDWRDIRAAAAIIRDGGLVAVPTETVYGLAADALNDAAVARIFAAKGRPSFNPLIVHVADIDAAESLADVAPLARRLAEAFWPGPLTLVLPRRADAGVSPRATAGLATIALRAPDHPIMRALLSLAGRPLAAPSANRSGEVSPTRAEHVRDSLGTAVDMILDGGPCAVGVESTIVRVDGDRLFLLRPGGLARGAIERVAGRPLERPDAAARPEAPGMLASHYAPAARLRLDAAAPAAGEAYLAFGPAPEGAAHVFSLSEAGDLGEAAARLYAQLRAADARCRTAGLDGIAVAPIPREGLGEAINDRLARAAAPRGDVT